MKILHSIFILVIFLSFISASCSRSDTSRQIQVPQYPGATVSNDMNPKFLGMSVGKILKVVTNDSYDKVFAFYNERLKTYNPKIMTHTIEDGRQTTMTLADTDKFSITIAIQEFRKESKVTITYMRFSL